MVYGDPLELVTEGREKLEAEERALWSSAALSDRMLALGAEVERLQAEFVRLTAEWNAAGAWGADGFVSPGSWLTANAHMAKPAAGRLLRSARHVRRFAATGEALADGTVTAEKVELLARSARHREKFYERDEQVLLDVARRLSARDLELVLRTWCQLADDEQANGDADKAFDRVHLDIANSALGSALAGSLDPQGTALVTKALDLIEPPDVNGGPDLPRTLSQRRGEGLVKLAQYYLHQRGASAAGRSVANVQAVFTPQGDDVPIEWRRSAIEGFGPVPVSTIERLVCEACVGWIVIDRHREVLDMGRRSRTVTPAQRRAVVVRDEHCQHPGCRAAADWCDVHHLVEWEWGGATDLDNLVLLCRRHHVAVHEGRRRLVPDRSVPGERFRVERRE
ncbi:MAG: DUF222 domain-containing protein [Acidimicrobiia bacterium]